MRYIIQLPRVLRFAAILLFVHSPIFSQVLDQGRDKLNKPEIEIPEEIFWDVKAYSPTFGLLRVKAIDKDGNIHNVKAIQDSDDTSVLNVKALVNGERLPIKLIVKRQDVLYPVKAIDPSGTIIDIKALTDDGEKLDVKGFGKTGNIVNLRAISPQPVMYNIIAISPDGQVNQVKGLKMMSEEIEGVVYGVQIFAHVKAMGKF